MTDKERRSLLSILQEYFHPREEGWVWLAPHGDRAGGVISQVEGAYDDPDVAASAFVRILRECEAEGGFLAICRWDGRPTESDRELWRMIRAQVPVEQLGDMVVFNDQQTWSMREEDAAAA
jgi:hypothetical protein